MLEELPWTNLINKELCSITPILSLIGLLAIEWFSDALGHPIGKLAWSTLTDEGIFNWFDQIWRNLFCYHSGCQNRKNSYEVSKDPWVFTLASNFFVSLFSVSLLSLQLAFYSRFLSHSWDPIMLWNQDCDMKLTIMATIIEKFATWKWL
jgi:hypothetical protein